MKIELCPECGSTARMKSQIINHEDTAYWYECWKEECDASSTAADDATTALRWWNDYARQEIENDLR